MNIVRSITSTALATGLLLLWGCAGSSSDTAGSSSNDALLAKGEKIYRVQCLMCHQTEGEGIPDLQPPLAGSEVVLGDPALLVAWVLEGSAAKQGQSEYSNFMPPFEMLSDEDIAAVVTYIRTSFGNEGSRIEPEHVTALRAESGG